MSKKKTIRKPEAAAPSARPDRRKFMLLGLGGLGAAAAAAAGYQAGWFSSAPATAPVPAATPWYPNDINAVAKSHLAPTTLSLDLAGATRASDDIVRHYARELNSPSALIHAVRGFGKSFTLADGTNAVDHLCAKYFAEKEVNGKKYIYVPREFEVHDNSFLKTMLEAGVSHDQPITAGGNKYTLHDLCESAKALFRFDPNNTARYEPSLFTQHMPWGLIAFSILIPPSAPSWVNAYGETINFNAVIDSMLSNYEGMCEGLHDSLARGEEESLAFRQQIVKHSCYGMHSIYGFLSCLKHGYTENRLQERAHRMCALTIERLLGDSRAIDKEANAAKGMGPDLINRLAVSQDGKVVTKGVPPADTIEVMRLRSQIRFIGHAFESLNYAQLHKLFTPSADQKKKWQAGEKLMFEHLIKLRATDLRPYWDWYSKFVSNLVIALSHASRGMKLLTPENPDTSAKSIA
jgi:hypothetical protein